MAWVKRQDEKTQGGLGLFRTHFQKWQYIWTANSEELIAFKKMTHPLKSDQVWAPASLPSLNRLTLVSDSLGETELQEKT